MHSAEDTKLAGCIMPQDAPRMQENGSNGGNGGDNSGNNNNGGGGNWSPSPSWTPSPSDIWYGNNSPYGPYPGTGTPVSHPNSLLTKSHMLVHNH